MTLKDKLANPAPIRMGGWCKMCLILKDLSTDDREALEVVLNDRQKWTNVAILEVLRSESFDIGRSSIERHRKGQCKGD